MPKFTSHRRCGLSFAGCTCWKQSPITKNASGVTGAWRKVRRKRLEVNFELSFVSLVVATCKLNHKGHEGSRRIPRSLEPAQASPDRCCPNSHCIGSRAAGTGSRRSRCGSVGGAACNTGAPQTGRSVRHHSSAMANLYFCGTVFSAAGAECRRCQTASFDRSLCLHRGLRSSPFTIFLCCCRHAEV